MLFCRRQAVPVFRRQLTCNPFENFGEIFGIAVTHASAHVLNISPRVLQQFFCLFHPQAGEICGKILIEALLKQTAEIYL